MPQSWLQIKEVDICLDSSSVPLDNIFTRSDVAVVAERSWSRTYGRRVMSSNPSVPEDPPCKGVEDDISFNSSTRLFRACKRGKRDSADPQWSADHSLRTTVLRERWQGHGSLVIWLGARGLRVMSLSPRATEDPPCRRADER
ncbi:hypothetical protein TNCV_2536691 [Trichonephila clavipes]|nr:hypothetical protein TNCV_2536691 [Trichonephila clavipes]